MEPFRCPRCNGQGHTAKPPWIPGDVNEWVSDGTVSYPCPICKGTGVLWKRQWEKRLLVPLTDEQNERIKLHDELLEHEYEPAFDDSGACLWCLDGDHWVP